MLVEQADRMPREALAAIEGPSAPESTRTFCPAKASTINAISMSSSIGARPSASCSASVRKSPIMSWPFWVTSGRTFGVALASSPPPTEPSPALLIGFATSGMR